MLNKKLLNLRELHAYAKPYHGTDEIDDVRTKANADFFLAAHESFGEILTLIEEGDTLSKYVASIHWDGSENTEEWLDGLENRIESMQNKYEKFLVKGEELND